AGRQAAYQHLLFERLAMYYLDKKRYQEAALVLLRYNEVFPDSVRAQAYQVNVIAMYQQAGFSGLVLEEKARFVNGLRRIRLTVHRRLLRINQIAKRARVNTS
ncbi:MAG: hypothetical protein P8104_08475, partial [Gammaproteobacteria bacterium]